MQDITVTFSPDELSFLRIAVSNERQCILDDLDGGKIVKSEIKDALKSIELCNSIIDKIDTALPNAIYEHFAHKP